MCPLGPLSRSFLLFSAPGCRPGAGPFGQSPKGNLLETPELRVLNRLEEAAVNW